MALSKLTKVQTLGIGSNIKTKKCAIPDDLTGSL